MDLRGLLGHHGFEGAIGADWAMGSERAMGAEACNSQCSTLYLVLLYWAVLSCSKLNRAVLGYTTYATDCA